MVELIYLLLLCQLINQKLTSKIFKMKKIAYLFVAFAFLGVIALTSCKTKTVETTEPVMEEAPVEVPVDTMVSDSAVVVE